VLAAPLLLLVGAALAYTKLAERTPIVAVPDVVNRDVFTAVAMMKHAQLEVQAVAADSPQPGGVVLSQRPQNGQKLELGSVVRLTVSRTSATVPDVVSLDEAAARSVLARRGLANLTVAADYRDDVDAGIVVGTSPPAFVQAAKTAPIQLIVARDPRVTLPNVVRLDQATATDQLHALGLQVVIETATSKGVVAGQVSRMSPTAKEVVMRGNVVTLTVSSGPSRRKS
jgi:serine/threonine-protein kinase